MTDDVNGNFKIFDFQDMPAARNAMFPLAQLAVNQAFYVPLERSGDLARAVRSFRKTLTGAKRVIATRKTSKGIWCGRIR